MLWEGNLKGNLKANQCPITQKSDYISASKNHPGVFSFCLSCYVHIFLFVTKEHKILSYPKSSQPTLRQNAQGSGSKPGRTA